MAVEIATLASTPSGSTWISSVELGQGLQAAGYQASMQASDADLATLQSFVSQEFPRYASGLKLAATADRSFVRIAPTAVVTAIRALMGTAPSEGIQARGEETSSYSPWLWFGGGILLVGACIGIAAYASKHKSKSRR